MVRGVLGVAIGILSIMWPRVTLAVLIVLFGAYTFLDGVVNLALGVTRDQRHRRSWIHVVLGTVGVAAGIIAFFAPRLTLFVLVMSIAAWAIVHGVLELLAAVRLRRVITGEWLLGLSGALSVIFGLVVFVFPGLGALAVAWLFGIYALTAGILLIILGVKVRHPLTA
jgi:uncharacterized membrane protein HdeD (DUF308 family)